MSTGKRHLLSQAHSKAKWMNSGFSIHQAQIQHMPGNGVKCFEMLKSQNDSEHIRLLVNDFKTLHNCG